MMTAEMTRLGIGDPRTGWDHLSPDRMLDSEDTAVVVVEGVIPPGAPKGLTFDVRVFALPVPPPRASRVASSTPRTCDPAH